MDHVTRASPREYPPFGDVPAAVEGSPELRLQLEGIAASLTGFVCSPSGLSATLRTAARVPEGGDVTYAFAERQQMNDAVDIWAMSTGSGTEPTKIVHAHLLSGGGGTEGTLHASLFHLWFPLDVATLTGDLTVEMVWPTQDTAVRVGITATSLRQAADRADTRFIGT